MVKTNERLLTGSYLVRFAASLGTCTQQVIAKLHHSQGSRRYHTIRERKRREETCRAVDARLADPQPQQPDEVGGAEAGAENDSLLYLPFRGGRS